MGHLKTPALMLLAIVALVGLARWGVPLVFSSGEGNASVRLAVGMGGQPSAREDAKAWAAKTPQLLGGQTCAACHGDKAATLSDGSHATVTCENCHAGPAREHIEKRAALGLDPSQALCVRCHGKVIGRPTDFPQVVPQQHAGEAACVACHDPHSPRLGVVGVSSQGEPRQPTPAGAVAHAAASPLPTPTATPTPAATPTQAFPPTATVMATATPSLTAPPPQVGGTPPAATRAVSPTPTSAPSPTPTPTPTFAPPSSTPTPTPATAGGAPQVPHQVAGRADCILCHGPGRLKPFPTDHTGRTNETCLMCHKSR